MITAEAKRTRLQHWKKALPFYLKISFIYSAYVWVPTLVIFLLAIPWFIVTRHRMILPWKTLEFGVAFGAFFGLPILLTAVGNDLYKNWKSSEPAIRYDPALPTKALLGFGALFFITSAFLSYHQGWHLSVFFGVMALGSLIVLRKCF
jgi:hypothetical protein